MSKSSVIIGVIIATLVLPTIPLSASEENQSRLRYMLMVKKEKVDFIVRMDILGTLKIDQL